MAVPIIIVQTSVLSFRQCERELQRNEFPAEKYLLVKHEEVAEKAVVPGERQLLVVGALDGSMAKSERFVARMRRVNPALMTGCFSFLEVVPSMRHFDLRMKKPPQRDIDEDVCTELIAEMKFFLATL